MYCALILTFIYGVARLVFAAIAWLSVRAQAIIRPKRVRVSPNHLLVL